MGERLRMGNERQVRRRKRQVLATISSSLLRSWQNQVKLFFLEMHHPSFELLDTAVDTWAEAFFGQMVAL